MARSTNQRCQDTEVLNKVTSCTQQVCTEPSTQLGPTSRLLRGTRTVLHHGPFSTTERGLGHKMSLNIVKG
jgi:hypothetical protein